MKYRVGYRNRDGQLKQGWAELAEPWTVRDASDLEVLASSEWLWLEREDQLPRHCDGCECYAYVEAVIMGAPKPEAAMVKRQDKEVGE